MRVHRARRLAVELHNAVVARNIVHIGKLVRQLRPEGHALDDAMLAQTTESGGCG